MRLVATLREPAYTGENRCLPCTVVNTVIAFVLASVTAGVVLRVATPTLAVLAAAAVFLPSAGAIYLRGYLVPGTPELTKRYLPRPVLAAFGKAPGGEAPPASGPSADFDVETELRAAGAIEPCADADDLCLTDPFGAAWRSAMDQVEAERDRLLSALDIDPQAVEFVEHGDAFRATIDGTAVGRWESAAAFRADLAAASVLEAESERWVSLSVAQRGQLLSGLRLFLEVCPDCGTDLSFETETVESCCFAREVAAVSCDGCGARLFESEPL